MNTIIVKFVIFTICLLYLSTNSLCRPPHNQHKSPVTECLFGDNFWTIHGICNCSKDGTSFICPTTTLDPILREEELMAKRLNENDFRPFPNQEMMKNFEDDDPLYDFKKINDEINLKPQFNIEDHEKIEEPFHFLEIV